jgi:hypothetical protein
VEPILLASFAAVISFAVTPLVRRAAMRAGAIAEPGIVSPEFRRLAQVGSAA